MLAWPSFSDYCVGPDSDSNCAPMISMTTLALVSIAFCIVTTVLVMVRRATCRVDSSRITVSRQWLTQHQSNDRS